MITTSLTNARRAVLVGLLTLCASACGSTTNVQTAAGPTAGTAGTVQAPSASAAATATPVAAESLTASWCALVIGESKADVLAAMGAPHGSKAEVGIQQMGLGNGDHAEWDLGNDLLLASFTNGKASNLQAYAFEVGPAGATDIHCAAFRH